MRAFNITGMNCAACSARVEKAVSKVKGVKSCSVSLLTNSMGVEGNASDSDIIKAVERAGYGASVKNREKKEKSEDDLKDRESPKLLKRLIASSVLMLILMYFTMGVMMWNWPAGAFFEKSHTALGLLELLLTLSVMIINGKFFISGFKSIIHLSPNMDALVAIGSSAAFIYSTYALFMMAYSESTGDHRTAGMYMNYMYFESAAMILTLITLGKLLESISKGKTTNAIKSLMKLSPKTATILVDGKEVEVSVDNLHIDDIFIVKPGENIPVDGVVIEGESAVNESALTGESIPEDKSVGSQVYSATANTSGYLKCKATKVGENTTLNQIISLISDASRTKAPIAKIADRVSSVFVPSVILIAIITTIGWLLGGFMFSQSLLRGISVLVISCPCALGLATPVAIMVGNGVAAKNGILFKTALSMENAGKCEYAILDKTGTITTGNPEVTGIYPYSGVTERELMEIAASLERLSEHPLSKAIMKRAEEMGVKTKSVELFKASSGNGLEGKIESEMVYGGNLKYALSVNKESKILQREGDELSEKGETPLFFVTKERLLGIISVRDIIKSDSKEAIEELKGEGVEVVMLTGDNERTAKAIAKEAGIESVESGVMPSGKERIVASYSSRGKTIMVGDGINDAPALTRATVGMAIGAGSDIAIDSADVVLIKSSLMDVPKSIRISRRTLRNIHENLFWAFGYNIIGIPLAAGVFVYPFGWEMNPMFAALCMSVSSFLVVTNALRLNFMNTSSTKHDRKIKHRILKKKENMDMKKEIKIEGMMCSHCEMTVKKALEGIDGVKKASVSHEKGEAVVELSKSVDDEALKKAVEDKDYKVLSIINA